MGRKIKNMEEEPKSKNNYTRPENLAKALFGAEPVFNEEERAMFQLLASEYKKTGRNLLAEIQKQRAESGEKLPLSKVIRVLYEEEEKGKNFSKNY